MKNEFQYRLVKSIEKAGITAAELSEKTGISEANISNYINGKYVAKQDKCYALAEALGVDPGWLMTGDEPRADLWEEEFIRKHNEMFGYSNDVPLTKEARIISGGIDKMPPERREQALKVLQTIFADYFDGGEEDGT